MTEERIQRLNELARKYRAEGLTEEELAERATLREEYLESFRRSLTAHLDTIYFVDEQGNQEKLRKKGE